MHAIRIHYYVVDHLKNRLLVHAGADTGSIVGGGPNPRGALKYKFVKFVEKRHEMKKKLFLRERWAAPGPTPLDSSLQ